MLALEVRITEPNGDERIAKFGFGPVLVGRSPLCQLNLSQPWVSNTEGSITFDAGSINYLNIGSGNKSRLNGEVLAFHTNVPLDQTSELAIGDVKLRFRLQEVADNDPAVLAKRPNPEPGSGSPSPKTVVWPAGGLTGTTAKEGGAGADAPPSGQVRRHSRPPKRTSTAPPPPPAPSSGAPAGPVRSVPPPPSAPTGATQAPAGAGLDGLHAAYRASWSALMAKLRDELDRLPDDERAKRAKALQREYRQLTREPEFRAYLQEHGLVPHKPGVPELEEWLQAISDQVLPQGVKLESGFSLGRLIQLIEALAAGFSMISADQERVREAMFKLPRRDSLLYHDDAKVMLAYLLNPEANWAKRSQELLEAVKDLFVHQSAMVQAMGAGARDLLQALSPKTIAGHAGVALPSPEDGPRDRGFLGRVMKSEEPPEVALWRTYSALHHNLMSGRQYEQTFHGKSFRQKYNRAVGQLQEGNDGE